MMSLQIFGLKTLSPIKAQRNIDIFMPIIVDVDNQNQFVGFTNEAVWAASFPDELGILD
jgi:hypothetical protein